MVGTQTERFTFCERIRQGTFYVHANIAEWSSKSINYELLQLINYISYLC